MTEQPTEKTCTKCGETKPLEGFHRKSSSSDGLTSECKECRKAYSKKYYADNRESVRMQHREYYEENKEDLLAAQRRYYQANLERIRGVRQDYYQANRDSIRAKSKQWYAENIEWCRESSRRYREQHAEATRKQQAEYRRRNRAKILERKRQFYRENRDQILSTQKDWRKNNPDIMRERNRKKHAQKPHLAWASGYRARAIKHGRSPVVEDFTKADVIARYGDHCAYCDTGAFEHLDHYVPIKAGGPHTLDNVRPACASCNNSKYDTDPEEWLAQQAELDNLTEDELEALIDAEIAKYLNEED